MKTRYLRSVLTGIAVLAYASAAQAAPLGTAFTYQGQLIQGGATAQLVSDDEETEIADVKGRLARMERIVEQLVSEKEGEKP